MNKYVCCVLLAAAILSVTAEESPRDKRQILLQAPQLAVAPQQLLAATSLGLAPAPIAVAQQPLLAAPSLALAQQPLLAAPSLAVAQAPLLPPQVTYVQPQYISVARPPVYAAHPVAHVAHHPVVAHAPVAVAQPAIAAIGRVPLSAAIQQRLIAI